MRFFTSRLFQGLNITDLYFIWHFMLCHCFLDIKKTQEAGASIRVRTFLMKAVFYELPIFQTLRRACKPNFTSNSHFKLCWMWYSINSTHDFHETSVGMFEFADIDWDSRLVCNERLRFQWTIMFRYYKKSKYRGFQK